MECDLLWCTKIPSEQFHGFCSWEHYEEALCQLEGCKELRRPTPDRQDLHLFCCIEHRHIARGDRPERSYYQPSQGNCDRHISPCAGMECDLLWCTKIIPSGQFHGFCSWEHYEEALCQLKGCKELRRPTSDFQDLHPFCCIEHRHIARGGRPEQGYYQPSQGLKCYLPWCKNPRSQVKHRTCSYDHYKEALCPVQGCKRLRPLTHDQNHLHNLCTEHYWAEQSYYSYQPLLNKQFEDLGGESNFEEEKRSHKLPEPSHGELKAEQSYRKSLQHFQEQERNQERSWEYETKPGYDDEPLAKSEHQKQSNRRPTDKPPETEQRNFKLVLRSSKKGPPQQQIARPIHFYDRNDPYYEFTNFYFGKPVTIDDLEWKTTEHYFQAQKFVGTPYVEVIRNLNRPREAFDFSRNPSVAEWIRRDWQQVKQTVMYKALLAKFSQSKRLREMLASTGDRDLVEHSPYDRYWGDGGDGGGKNHLGRLLMKVRSCICVGDAPPGLDQDDVESGSGGSVTGACVSSITTSTGSVTPKGDLDPQQPSTGQAPLNDSNSDPRQSSSSKTPGDGGSTSQAPLNDSNSDPCQSSPTGDGDSTSQAPGADSNPDPRQPSSSKTPGDASQAPGADSNPDPHQPSSSKTPGDGGDSNPDPCQSSPSETPADDSTPEPHQQSICH